MSRPLLLEHRLREIERPFGWIPLRLVTDGTWAALSAEAKILYCLLCIVSDRRGISFYGETRLQCDTGLSSDALAAARSELVARDLIAFDASRATVQVLSLPPGTTQLPDARQSTPHQARQTRIVSPPPPSSSTEQRLVAVRQLISTLTTTKRP